MATALIGHTGFVGGNLLAQCQYDACYNTANIGQIRGRHFDRVVCAGTNAVKWWANRNADDDRARIEQLIADLRQVTADLFILISTVDVYATPDGVTEADMPPTAGLHPYGLHRLLLEHFVAGQFPRCCIVRLPALFGAGLKKNALYDLMHDNRTDAINPASKFQWYPLRRLAADLDRVAGAAIQVMNFATEPVGMDAIHQRFFPHRSIGEATAPGANYDMRTDHAALLGGSGHYILDRPAIMAALAEFLSGRS